MYPIIEYAFTPSSPMYFISMRFMQRIVTGVVSWESISGRPRVSILPTRAASNFTGAILSTPRFLTKCTTIIASPATCEMPVAIAAPAMPFCSGKTNSQSRKMFSAVLTMVEAMTNTGAPSLRPKP